MEIESAVKQFWNINLPYYSESLSCLKRNIDVQEIKEQLGQHEIILKKKKGIKLTRTKSIKKIYSIKLLRNKKDSSKIIFKLEMIGETTDKYDFQDYKDIFFEQPISTDDLIDSFKQEVIENIEPHLQPQRRNIPLNIKQTHELDQGEEGEGYENEQEDKIHDQPINKQSSQDEINVNGIHEDKIQLLRKDELNPRIYHYCIQPQSFMKNYKLNKLEFFRENLNQVQKQPKHKTVFQSLQVGYNDLQVPTPPNYVLDSFQEEELFTVMKRLFQDKPIWIRNSLIVSLNQLNIKYTLFNFRKALAILSYNFKDGPWKHAYVRFGYNPKLNKDAVKYQVIDIVVLDKEDYEQAKEYNPLQNTYDPTYIEKPQHYRHMYMLCEIKDDHVIKFFAKALEKNEYKDKIVPCKKSGWLQSIDIKRIQKVMKDKFKFN